MFITYGLKTDFFSLTMTDMLKLSPRPGNNQKETDRNSAVYRGQIDTYQRSLEHFGNHLRVQRIKPLLELFPEELKDPKARYSWLPGMSGSEIGPWWRDIKERWDNGEWKEVSDEELFPKLYRSFLDTCVFTEEWLDYEFQIRKTLIKAGAMEPEEKDEPWIEAELQAVEALYSPIQRIAKKRKMA